MSHRFSGGKSGYFTCDRIDCDAPLLHGSLMHFVGPLPREQQRPQTGYPRYGELRRDYCSPACLRAVEGGDFEPMPHAAECITVKKYHRNDNQFHDVVICRDGCELKDSPQRWRRKTESA